MLELSSSKSGQPIARIKGIHLHSPYDPQKEARRFLQESIKQANPSTILLLGAGLGYLYRETTESFPNAGVVVVFYHEEVVKSFSPGPPPGMYWHPGQDMSLLQFLRNRIHELEAEGLAVVEWPPSARIFPEVSLRANEALHQLFREIRGTLVTTAALGKRWLRNSLGNFLGIEEVFPPAGGGSGAGPTVIAASGPSLEQGIDFLARYREYIELWALPSSLDFLLSRDLRPDTVVMTDPSYYAFTHLGCAKDHSIHLTMPLSAAKGSWRISARVSLVNQETPVERQLLDGAGVTVPSVPAQGTVAATALILALRLREAPVVFTGLDFCYRDILSHVRPNNFENWLEPESNRLAPLHHKLFALAAEQAPAKQGGMRRTLALDTYAGWFAETGMAAGKRTGEKRICRFHPSEIPLRDIENIEESELQRLIRKRGGKAAHREEPLHPLESYPNREKRAEIVSSLLAGWIEKTERLSTAIGVTGTLEPLMRDSANLSTLYLCNASELTEIRRTLRLQGRKAGVDKSKSVLENHVLFLRQLSRDLEGK
jgi:hypothetical protein